VEVEELVTSISEDPGNMVEDFVLAQNYPNPFNPTTRITYSIPSAEMVQLTVFNSLGQKINTLISENMPAGDHQVTWNGRDDQGNAVPAGVYFYQMKAGDYQQTRKMLLVK
jgi:flagellar hook assembly protein FlgD